MNPPARELKPEEIAHHNGGNNYPVNEESKRIRTASKAGTLILEAGQVITFHHGLYLGFLRPDGIYTDRVGGKRIAPLPTPDLPSPSIESKD